MRETGSPRFLPNYKSMTRIALSWEDRKNSYKITTSFLVVFKCLYCGLYFERQLLTYE